jgi:hypothetical protein
VSPIPVGDMPFSCSSVVLEVPLVVPLDIEPLVAPVPPATVEDPPVPMLEDVEPLLAAPLGDVELDALGMLEPPPDVLGVVLDTLPPLDVPAPALAPELLGLALGTFDIVPLLDVAPLSVPGDPGLLLIRPVEFGIRLTSELPGLVTVDPPLDSVPLVPPPLTLLVEPPASAACA